MSEEKDFIKKLYNLKVKDLMEPINQDMPLVEKNDDISSVLSFLGKKDHVWVVDSRETLRILGVITEYDTLSLFSPLYTPLQYFDKPPIQSFHYGLDINVEEVMSKNPISTFFEEKIMDVILKMKQHKVKQLPVVDKDNKLLGEIKLRHLIDSYTKEQSSTKEANK
ncbi:MAG: CBS domain-containing protein [Candidatus Thermoplasmatota archaeon]|jgi:predicted transcriptional regulator|nr:CBS domain-containing protein [Candidatus Thermoplasmatota archaeon]